MESSPVRSFTSHATSCRLHPLPSANQLCIDDRCMPTFLVTGQAAGRCFEPKLEGSSSSAKKLGTENANLEQRLHIGEAIIQACRDTPAANDSQELQTVLYRLEDEAATIIYESCDVQSDTSYIGTIRASEGPYVTKTIFQTPTGKCYTVTARSFRPSPLQHSKY